MALMVVMATQVRLRTDPVEILVSQDNRARMVSTVLMDKTVQMVLTDPVVHLVMPVNPVNEVHRETKAHKVNGAQLDPIMVCQDRWGHRESEEKSVSPDLRVMSGRQVLTERTV